MNRLWRGALALALCSLACDRAFSGEVAEDWEDGTPRKRFTVDDAGRKDGRYVERYRDGKLAIDAIYHQDRLEGTYVEWHESGTPRVRTAYRGGRRHGKYETFGPDGEATEVAKYEDGALDGKRLVSRARKLVTTQTWKAGTLVTMDGAPAFARTKEETAAVVAKILEGSLPVGPVTKGKPSARAKPSAAPTEPSSPAPGLLDAPEPLATDRERALRRLRAYRYVCGIPWEDLVAGERETVSAQYAALVCAKLGHITHEPTNPGLPGDVFRRGAEGAAACNLAGPGETATESMDGWMDDSDPSNIGAVGHRRWALSMHLQRTGFGVASTAKGLAVSAMHVQDWSRVVAAEPPFVCFPPAGWVPSDMVSSHHAWHVSPGEVASLKIRGVLKARVRRLSADFVPGDAELATEAETWDASSIGGRPAFIFRPKGVEVADGAAYAVEIGGIDPKSRKPIVLHRWTFAFFGAPRERDGRDAVESEMPEGEEEDGGAK